MDQSTLEYFRHKLIDERKRHEHILNLMQENNQGEQDRFASGELSNYDNHPADLGTEVFQVSMNNALKVNEEHALSQIDNAIEQINNGTYGVCSVCKKDIDKGRLEILPYARKCIECENEYRMDLDEEATRPVEELVIDAPFGRKYLNKQEDDEYEGLEYLQDLYKYGNADSPQDLGGYADFDDFYTNEVDRQGMVEDIENISNEDYKKQLPD